MKTSRYVAEPRRPHLIVGDAYGNEEAVRRVAKDYPTTAFWLHEPVHLCGLHGVFHVPLTETPPPSD